MHKQNCQSRGFTLIELLIIVAIIGILASIVIPKVSGLFKEEQVTGQQGVTSKPPRQEAIATPVASIVAKIWPPLTDNNAQVQTNGLLRKNYYVVFDGSGSMRDSACSGVRSKTDAAIEAMLDFFAAMPKDVNVGLLVFDSAGLFERIPLGSDNRAQLAEGIRAVRPDGGTPLDESIKAGYKALTNQAVRQLGYGEYHLIVVTDGEATVGSDPTTVVNQIIDQTPIVVHTIGFCIGEGHSLNQPGRTLYRSVDNAGDLSRELKAVLAESETFDVAQFK